MNRATSPGSERPPGEMPVLSKGRHRDPREGACLMEYVSVLAGEAFSDGPRCTHPALAALARLVNDRIVDRAVRNGLALLAPDLIGPGVDDPRITERVVASCLLTAAAAGSLPRPAQRRLARASHRLRRMGEPTATRSWRHHPRWSTCRERMFTPPDSAAASAFEVLARRTRGLPPSRQDALLADLLRDVVAECRQLLGLRTPATVATR